MNALRSLLGISPARCPPPIVESDEIFPVHMLDDTKTRRNMIMTWMLRFNDVLDADKLHASLSRLLEIGDWRKIGGRLRLKDNGKLEIHVPQPFTAGRPAVSYTHQVMAMAIQDHPLAKTLPKATSAPSIQPVPDCFRTFAAREDAPVTIQDYIDHDIPQLALHVTSFTDATLVGLSWPHTLMDVMGQKALLHGWSLVLADREFEVPPMLGAREDVIRAEADAPMENPEEFEVGQKQLKGWARVIFALRLAWDMLWNPVVETRTICLPKKAMAQLQHQAQLDLTVQGDGEEKPFVSEGDVLTAWAARAVASSLPQPRPVTVLQVFNTRFRLSSLIQSSGTYIQNMWLAAFVTLSPELATGPLGHIALENRCRLLEQSTEGQVLAFLRQLRQESKSGRDPSLICSESYALLMPFTNWTRANIVKTANFSPAVVRAGETGESRRNPPGTMIFHHSQVMQQNSMTRNLMVVLGKDHDDNYWLVGSLLAPAWAKIEEEIKKL